jgi:RimJ/RimL family protein N-acetyltransferase
MTSPLTLLDMTVELLDAAIEDQQRLGRLLDASVAAGWEGFPEALPILRRSCAEGRGGGADGGGRWGGLFFLLQAPRVLAGMGGYKGGPSREGIVEIGYAIAPELRGRGLATLATRLMLRRAFADPAITAVDAHTLAQENPSTRVLRKTGFTMIGEVVDPDDGALWHWRAPRPPVQTI